MVNNVKSVTIDDFVKNNKIERIDVVKIDVEGNEFNVLKGAKTSILSFRPVILCEINPEMNEKAGYASNEMLDFITHTLGYYPVRLQNNKFLLVNEKKAVKLQSNMFFCPKEKWGEVSKLTLANGDVFRSVKFWEERYATGGDSGAGSYNKLAQFKAETLNKFIKDHAIQSVLEFGCGDGNQLSLAEYPQYLGFDVSQTIITHCREKFIGDKAKNFLLTTAYSGQKAELTLSLDVIYHLIEDEVFHSYMTTLFAASLKYVIIYSSNSEQVAGFTNCIHVKHRKFTDWMEKNAPEWKLTVFIPNKYPFSQNRKKGSFADFYVYEK